MTNTWKQSRRAFIKAGGLVAAGIAAAPLLQACTPPAAAPTLAPTKTDSQPKPPAAAKVTGKFQFIMKQDWNKQHNEYIRDELLKYGKEKGWDMDVSYTEGFAAGGNIIVKLTASVQAGDPPDGMFQYQVSLFQLQFLDLIVPLDDLVKENIQKFGEPTSVLKKYSYIKDKWYGVPWIILSGAFWVRKDILAAAGIKEADIPKAFETYEKARETCMQVSDPAKEKWGWALTVNRSSDGNSGVYKPMHSWGGYLCDEAGEIVTLNSPETVACVKWLYETHKDPKYDKMRPPGLGGWTDPSNNEAFLASKIFMTDNGGTLYAQGRQEKWQYWDQVMAIRNPGGPARAKGLHGNGGPAYFSFKGAKNFDAFKELTRHMMQQEKITFLAKNSPGWCLPCYEKMWTDEILKLDPNTPFFKDIAMDKDGYIGAQYPGPRTPAADACVAANLLTDMVGAVMGGQKAEDAVKAAHDKAIQVYKEFGMKAVKS
jgi:multiple sugar transport system substrate-binding protein